MTSVCNSRKHVPHVVQLVTIAAILLIHVIDLCDPYGLPYEVMSLCICLTYKTSCYLLIMSATGGQSLSPDERLQI